MLVRPPFLLKTPELLSTLIHQYGHVLELGFAVDGAMPVFRVSEPGGNKPHGAESRTVLGREKNNVAP